MVFTFICIGGESSLGRFLTCCLLDCPHGCFQNSRNFQDVATTVSRYVEDVSITESRYREAVSVAITLTVIVIVIVVIVLMLASPLSLPLLLQL